MALFEQAPRTQMLTHWWRVDERKRKRITPSSVIINRYRPRHAGCCVCHRPRLSLCRRLSVCLSVSGFCFLSDFLLKKSLSHSLTHTRARTHTYTHTHTRTHARTHAYTHTHIHAQTWASILNFFKVRQTKKRKTKMASLHMPIEPTKLNLARLFLYVVYL